MERYERLGASGDNEGMYVRFEPGFGLNVYIGVRRKTDGRVYHTYTYQDYEERGMVMSIDGWETLGELVDEWRERERLLNGTDASSGGSSQSAQ